MTAQEQYVQLRAASTLLERGVLIDRIGAPWFLRAIGRRHLNVTLHQPTLGELVEISESIAAIGLDEQELQTIGLSDVQGLTSGLALKAMEILLIATRLKVPFWSRERLARYLLARIDAARFERGWRYFVAFNGVADFTHTIRSMAQTSNLSPMVQRSQAASQAAIASGE